MQLEDEVPLRLKMVAVVLKQVWEHGLNPSSDGRLRMQRSPAAGSKPLMLPSHAMLRQCAIDQACGLQPKAKLRTCGAAAVVFDKMLGVPQHLSYHR